MTRVVRVETGAGHRYETTDGTPVPGVTTIIGKSVLKPALVPWAAKATAAYTVNNWEQLTELPVANRLERITKEWRGVRDRAAARGTRVHTFGEAIIGGQGVELPDEYVPYVQPYVDFLDRWQVHPVHVEAVVWSETPLYAGTLDLIAQVGPRRMLIDLKTTGSGVWPETGLQLAAYAWADHLVADGQNQPMPEVDAAAVVWLPGDGTCHFIPVDISERIYEAFCAAYEIAAWTDIRKSDLIGRALQPPVTEGTA